MPPRLGRWFSGHYQLIGKLCSRPISYFLDFLQIIFSSDTKFVSLLLLFLILAALDLSCAVWALLVAARGISYSMACGILVPLPGIKPEPPAVEACSLNHQGSCSLLLFFGKRTLIFGWVHFQPTRRLYCQPSLQLGQPCD